jgi:hypothetical protein
MKGGKYYVGDPCYIFDEHWVEILDQTNFLEDGHHTIFGERIFAGGTAYGDGSYSDQYGRHYWVDAGLLAVVPVSLLKIDNKKIEDQINDSNLYFI